MVHFKKQDYEEILYPVHTLKKGMDLFATFPKLLEHKEFQISLPASLNKEKVFTYIVYVYDKKSPFRTQIEDLRRRKIEAAMESGFSTSHNGGFSESVKGLLNCENTIINKMIIRYLRLQGKDFTGLVVDQEAYYQINLQQIEGISSTDNDALKTAKSKAELSKMATEYRERLDDSARNFLEQEEAIGLHNELWNLAEDEVKNIKLTPEDYAAQVQES
jgi:hypothetical protein